jgi:hypothetical protein
MDFEERVSAKARQLLREAAGSAGATDLPAVDAVKAAALREARAILRGRAPLSVQVVPWVANTRDDVYELRGEPRPRGTIIIPQAGGLIGIQWDVAGSRVTLGVSVNDGKAISST